MTAKSNSGTRYYDLFKAAVALLLLIIIVAILLLQARSSSQTAEVLHAPPAVPVPNAPQLSDDGDLSLTGTGEPGSIVELWAGGRKLGTTTVGSDGTWSFDGELDSGDYDLVARTIDAEGKTINESEALVLNVPQPAVDIALPELKGPEFDAEGGLSLTGTGEPGSTVELWTGSRKLGTTTVGSDGTWSFDGELDPGDHDLVARTIDAEGKTINESMALVLNVPQPPVDIALPELTDPEFDAEGGFALAGSGEPGSIVELWAGNRKLGTAIVGSDGAWSFDGELDPGDYDLLARTIDAEGQALNESKALVLNVPQPPVDIALPELEDPKFDSEGGFSLAGTGEPGSIVELWAGSRKLGTATAGNDGAWSFDGELDPGDYDLVARTIDASGKTINESKAIVLAVPEELAMVAPILYEPQINEAGTVTLSGTGEPGADMEVLEDGIVVGTAIVRDDGSWTFTYTTLAGAHTLDIRHKGKPDSGRASASLLIAPAESVAADTGSVPEVPAGGQAYIVKGGDWLRDLARTYLGDAELYPLIVNATNTKAAEDPSFAWIWSSNLIRPGWKLWIPGP